MKPLNTLLALIGIIVLFSSCSSAQKLQNKLPFTLGEVYFQKWVGGVKDGASGIDFYISGDLPKNIQMDSVYFRGKSTRLQKLENSSSLYVGRFKSNLNPKPDVVMSSDHKEEFGNEFAKLDKNIPFDLKNSECVISYQEDSKTKYFKIENIHEKSSQNYPIGPSDTHE